MMQPVEALRAVLSQNADSIDHRIDILHRAGPVCGVKSLSEVARKKAQMLGGARRFPPRHRHHAVAIPQQALQDVAPDEAGCPSKQHSHGCTPESRYLMSLRHPA